MRRRLLDGLLFVSFLWSTHALAFLLHEYGHSFTAWLLGWKANPLAITYGHLTLPNLAFLSDFDENVQYAPIFAAGRGIQAALIALAGILVNALLYFAARAAFSFARRRNLRGLGLFAFLFCLMNVGNFIDYVPTRTFATHADMATLEKGLRIGPWTVVVLLGLPFALAIGHFFAVLLPRACAFLFPGRFIPRIVLAIVSAGGIFVYYGGSGMHGYGPVSHWISVVFIGLAFPLSLVLVWPRLRPAPVRSRKAPA